MQAVGEAVAGQAHGFAEILKLTIAVTGAGYALLIMIGKNHFHLQTLHVTHMFGEGVNSHAFFHGGVTGGDDARAQSVGHFRKAYAAGGGFVPERLKAAQRRDEDAVAAGHMQNGFPRFERIFLSVDECFHRNSFVMSWSEVFDWQGRHARPLLAVMLRRRGWGLR